ncbi:B-cell CLL/lymphoma 7 protein family member C [Striga asiatica]|uniref:B-cell CLL/lymphoma 7 protein family member C n=1 Tax=Striga asiatica TaxID=4170 RepID=A0A5A7QT41_STRAF|nr:B-cell CLL/lymphoma 7 protein family member C [Striga asiatica]
MEGVGARLGRSSTRYGPTTVFTGPVRRWKKRWVHVPLPNSSRTTATNGGNNGSNLLLLKWTPVASNQAKDGSHGHDNSESGKDDVVAAEETPRKKFKYIPIDVLDELNEEPSEHMEDDETKSVDYNIKNMETTSKNHKHDQKPDINDVPEEENQGMKKNHVERQDLNVSTLDLSLGFNDQDGEEDDSDSKADLN